MCIHVIPENSPKDSLGEKMESLAWIAELSTAPE